jgi:hypothetical protein
MSGFLSMFGLGPRETCAQKKQKKIADVEKEMASCKDDTAAASGTASSQNQAPSQAQGQPQPGAAAVTGATAQVAPQKGGKGSKKGSKKSTHRHKKGASKKKTPKRGTAKK